MRYSETILVRVPTGRYYHRPAGNEITTGRFYYRLRRSAFLKLPYDLEVYVLTFLHYEDIVRWTMVNPGTRKWEHDSDFWRVMLNERHPGRGDLKLVPKGTPRLRYLYKSTQQGAVYRGSERYCSLKELFDRSCQQDDSDHLAYFARLMKKDLTQDFDCQFIASQAQAGHSKVTHYLINQYRGSLHNIEEQVPTCIAIRNAIEGKHWSLVWDLMPTLTSQLNFLICFDNVFKTDPKMAMDAYDRFKDRIYRDWMSGDRMFTRHSLQKAGLMDRFMVDFGIVDDYEPPSYLNINPFATMRSDVIYSRGLFS